VRRRNSNYTNKKEIKKYITTKVTKVYIKSQLITTIKKSTKNVLERMQISLIIYSLIFAVVSFVFVSFIVK